MRFRFEADQLTEARQMHLKGATYIEIAEAMTSTAGVFIPEALVRWWARKGTWEPIAQSPKEGRRNVSEPERSTTGDADEPAGGEETRKDGEDDEHVDEATIWKMAGDFFAEERPADRRGSDSEEQSLTAEPRGDGPGVGPPDLPVGPRYRTTEKK